MSRRQNGSRNGSLLVAYTGPLSYATFLLIFAVGHSAGGLLPEGVVYDPSIPAPRQFLGWDIGERHLRHHELVTYLGKIADTSDRVTMEVIGHTYGMRPLVMLTITSPENHSRLDAIRQHHLRLADPATSATESLQGLPVVVSMGYSVHGNEASATNAAALVAYHLAAGQGELMESLLREIVVRLDPCLNPDGYERFAQWVNDHRGENPNADRGDREHQEPWPRGRTNYYWFDLNRDWLPLQHPESRARMAAYRQWLPNVMLDFHEMNTDATFFFQPGVPARTHPLIPKRNVRLTHRMADFHAHALDQNGSLYFTEETFDDFYPGKGSTYPDLHGGIGILFEQASVRGHIQESDHGTVPFSFAIKNQILASLSSLRAARHLRRELLELKRDFYRDALALAENGPVEAYVVSAPGDRVRLNRFLEILLRHGIQVYPLKSGLTVNGHSFAPGDAYLIPTAQPEFRFLTALFERRTTFEDTTFYDVSTWTLPLAFDLISAEIRGPLPQGGVGDPLSLPLSAEENVATGENDIAYVVDGRSYGALRALYKMLDGDVRVKVAQEPFALTVDGKRREYGYGTLLVALGIQDKSPRANIVTMMQEFARDGLSVHAASTGLTESGIDFGSARFAGLTKPRVLLATGEGVSSYEAGEVWHLLDRRLAMPVTMIDTDRLGQTQLDRYTAVILVSGSYARVSNAAVQRLQRWLADGGTLISIGTAARWLNDKKIVELDFRRRSDEPLPEGDSPKEQAFLRRAYADRRHDGAAQQIRGAIFKTRIDVTHPVCYGYDTNELAVFRNNRVFLQCSASPYANPVVYADEPLISGYVSDENLELLRGTASVVVKQAGGGRAIVIAEDPNFRAFWYGTNRLFLNSIFFGHLVRE